MRGELSFAADCCQHGPGYRNPEDAIKNGPREKLLYTTCVADASKGKSDYLATVDVDPSSPTYSQVIHRCKLPNIGDEIHHSGWDACSSCYPDTSVTRSKLILPCMQSSRVYVIDVAENERAPKLHKIVEPEDFKDLDLSALHTPHCLASGEVMISSMGTRDGKAKGSFLVLDGKTFDVKGKWEQTEAAPFGYDFWYQPYYNVMISSSWGAPSAFKTGFDPQHIKDGLYGRQLTFWNWKEKTWLQTLDLGEDGIMPLETRFLHNPRSVHGFVGCAFSSTVFHIYRNDSHEWVADKVISVPTKKVDGWVMSDMGGLTTDILLSMDDKYLYISNWMHGDIRQYNVEDPFNPILCGQLFVGGNVVNDGKIKVIEDQELQQQPPPRIIKGRRIDGGPQMLQLSLDGKRLYTTTSVYSVWDKQFYPDLIKNGAVMMLINIDVQNGGMTLNEDFLVDFGKEPDGPALAHEMRYPNGDCSSDIFLA